MYILEMSEEPAYTIIRKKFKNEEDVLKQIRFMLYTEYNTKYEDVVFLNGNNRDIRRENLLFMNEPKYLNELSSPIF